MARNSRRSKSRRKNAKASTRASARRPPARELELEVDEFIGAIDGEDRDQAAEEGEGGTVRPGRPAAPEAEALAVLHEELQQQEDQEQGQADHGMGAGIQ